MTTGAPLGETVAFEERVRSASSLPALAHLFAQAVEPFGVSAYALGQLRGHGRPSTMFMTTWPRAWMELYAVNGFIADDPVVLEALRTREPFTWSELRARGMGASDRVLKAAESFGFFEGLVVPVHGPGDARGLVALAAARLRMTAAERAVLVARSRIVYDLAREMAQRPPRERSPLAPREREALALVAQGLDDAAIGAALGITRITAHVYVERAKRRLGAATRAQAVAVAIRDGVL